METIQGHCPVCREGLEQDCVTCPACRSLHHGDCWAWNHGCAIFGCSRAPRPLPFHAERVIIGAPPALPARTPMFQSWPWKVMDACVLAASYAMAGTLLTIASLPLFFIPLMHYFPD